MNEPVEAADRAANAFATPRGVDLVHLSPTIGTEVLGVDLREPLTAEMAGFLKALFLERKVLFFRDQDITPAQHVAFSRNWGELEGPPGGGAEHHPDQPEVMVIRREEGAPATENVWHADGVWRKTPALGAVLRARVVPEVGGDTMWSDSYAAYDALPEWLKRAVADLRAVNSVAIGHQTNLFDTGEVLKTFPPVTHPVIRIHPVTGKKLIFVNRVMTSHIVDATAADSRYLLERLYAQVAVPEFQCRFRWRANSIAFWDNRSTQHYALADYYPARRHMERVSIAGDEPF